MMNKMFLAFTTLLLTVNLANADFIPGRVRVSAEGELNAYYADGIFEGITKSKFDELYSDGKGITGYIAFIKDKKVNFIVTNRLLTRCGTEIIAETANSQTLDTIHYTLRLLADYEIPEGKSTCQGDQIKWNAEIKAVGGLKGTTSLIKLEGYPNYNLLTQ